MMEFIPGVIAPEDVQGDPIWFAFYQGKLLMVQDQHGLSVPQIDKFDLLGLAHDEPHYLGEWQTTHCFAVALREEAPLPPHFVLHDLRRVAMMIDPNLFTIAGKARQVLEWDRNHQYCGRCGTRTLAHDRDRAKQCPQCGHTQYPRISPCIIVLVTKGDEVLLARSSGFPPGMFSTLAGFVEPGETLEMAIHREIAEEVGVKVTNLEYMGSQPWPFPHSLMIGFHAEYAGGELVLEDDEIEEAGWWSINQLPMIPPRGSISHELIATYVKKMSSQGFN
ncbi:MULTISPECIES: NAD(+) diphosphatase [unclassified Ketobacter]|jgi:NAD+ diphosphatase|uniref:NAD(+) diphosphatase n=1 Tax=unclassified Ketobacter TaxID=2639109 RepID=UPI0025C19C58|nr:MULTISPECIES: NAD(+) diphosphatase [unclassified Ketobacter]MEC8810002.1 NAD(+) diphosphatase [Pseudomonadota bacterium]|tara:strand:- start:6064 stop:6897 length:834 start_codon:yes stop_codon:yes gene_type:complete